MAALEARDLVYAYRTKYRTVYAVNGLSCEFDRGRMYAIVGKSGSGKTTLLSLLAGLDTASEGEVLYDGVSMLGMDRDEYRRDHAAVIYQSFNLFPILTVIENVMYPLLMKKAPKAEARAAAAEKLRSVDLDETFHDRLPSMLSGGEQQRVAIARALAAGGDVILADEPTGNLDTENGRNIINILMRLAHEQNYCVIVVTHDPSIAEQADTVLRMQDGRLME